MPINTVIREKRKEIGLTQEQVAEYLGVTAPAVNKWEKGSTCPDIALLPGLARLLKTDLNTLLCFREGLSKQEIQYISQEIVKIIEKDGFAQGFEAATKKIREYPDCAELIHSTAMLLDGALMMSGMDTAEKAGYEEQIVGLYERAAASDNVKIQSSAAYMLASRFIRQEDYDRAREMLERIPEYNALDKRKLEADLLIKQGKTEEGAVLLERKLLSSLNEIQILLINLVSLAAQDGQPETAESLSALSQKFVRLFELWDYSAYVAPLEAALAQHKVSESLDALEKALAALLIPWDMHQTLLYRHIPHAPVNEKMAASFGGKVLPGLLAELENDSKYEFLRRYPEFQHLLIQYRDKLHALKMEAAT